MPLLSRKDKSPGDNISSGCCEESSWPEMCHNVIIAFVAMVTLYHVFALGCKKGGVVSAHTKEGLEQFFELADSFHWIYVCRKCQIHTTFAYRIGVLPDINIRHRSAIIGALKIAPQVGY